MHLKDRIRIANVEEEAPLCPLLAQIGHIIHSHLIQCSHSLNECRHHEHMKTALRKCCHIVYPPITPIMFPARKQGARMHIVLRASFNAATREFPNQAFAWTNLRSFICVRWRNVLVCRWVRLWGSDREQAHCNQSAVMSRLHTRTKSCLWKQLKNYETSC